MKKILSIILLLIPLIVSSQTFTLDNDTTGAFSKSLASFYPFATITTITEQYTEHLNITLYSDSSYIVSFNSGYTNAFTWEAGVVLYLDFQFGEIPEDIWFKSASTGVITINGVIKGK